MNNVNEDRVRQIVEEVVQRVVQSAPAGRATASPRRSGGGVFATVDEAVTAADRAQKELLTKSLEERRQVIEAIRQVTRDHADSFSRMTLEETGIGRLEDKLKKHALAADLTPGVEDLTSVSWTGDHGLTVEEMAPYGVICAVTPSTHPVPTLVNNAIGIIAAGNAVVVNPHPGAKVVSAHAVQLLNEAIVRAGGPANLVASIGEPTIESADELFHHRLVRLVLVTGGAAVAKAAMRSGKKAIAAGPGNPPVLVDETADIRKAARDIIDGAAFDNNVLCIGEKQCFVVDSVADELKREMLAYSAVELDRRQIEALTKVALPLGDDGKPHVNRDFVGRNANVLAASIGLKVDDRLRLLIGETDAKHAFVEVEQMMPFLPIIRVRNVEEGIRAAIESEHGYRHTAIIHSRNIENMHNMARAVDTTVFVKNGPSFAGLGVGGEGYATFSIAGPTGEGMTTARTFTRRRRCALIDYFRIT
ncbi:MAG: aldehyde dehydrogenase EutE [Gemmatimonadetes bacterium]|nr:aldehyde dehydrogenase EutE [Gemmatimonadota bacterium]